MDNIEMKSFTEARNAYVAECDWVLLNTFYELEAAATNALRNEGIDACPIGSLVFNPSRAQENPTRAEELVMATSRNAVWVVVGASLH